SVRKRAAEAIGVADRHRSDARAPARVKRRPVAERGVTRNILQINDPRLEAEDWLERRRLSSRAAVAGPACPSADGLYDRQAITVVERADADQVFGEGFAAGEERGAVRDVNQARLNAHRAERAKRTREPLELIHSLRPHPVLGRSEMRQQAGEFEPFELA